MCVLGNSLEARFYVLGSGRNRSGSGRDLREMGGRQSSEVLPASAASTFDRLKTVSISRQYCKARTALHERRPDAASLPLPAGARWRKGFHVPRPLRFPRLAWKLFLTLPRRHSAGKPQEASDGMRKGNMARLRYFGREVMHVNNEFLVYGTVHNGLVA